MGETTDIPVYEIDPKKKYVLRIPNNIPEAARERLRVEIRLWLCNPSMPFLIVNGDYVKLVKVEDADESR